MSVKTTPSYREDKSMIGFDVDSTFISMRLIKSMLRSVPGVSSIRRQFFSEDRITFVFKGVRCTINEPWGDNSQYWISPENVTENPIDMSQVHAVFAVQSDFSIAMEWLAWVAGGVVAFFLLKAWL